MIANHDLVVVQFQHAAQRLLQVLHSGHLDRATLEQTLGCVLKLHDDQIVVRDHREAIDTILGAAPTELPAGGYGLQTDFGFGSVSTPRRAPES
jgi:hypothetical protein